MIERDGPVGNKASNGEPYFTLTHCGRKDEGEAYAFVLLAKTEDGVSYAGNVVMNLLMEQIEAEKSAHAGAVLEWRTRPSVASFPLKVENLDASGTTSQFVIAARARLTFVSV